MRKILLAVALALGLGVGISAQQTQVTAQQFNVAPINQAPNVSNASAVSDFETGSTVRYYWIVTRLNGVASTPVQTSDRLGPATLSNTPGSRVTVTWSSPAPSATFDVLESSTATLPLLTNCNCAVQTGITGTSVIDVGTYSSYNTLYPQGFYWNIGQSYGSNKSAINFFYNSLTPACSIFTDGTTTCVSSGGGAVTSVSNSDGSLVISPTTGSVVASLNPANANTWTALQNMSAGLTVGGTLTTPITGLTQCVQVNSSGVASGTGVPCGAGSGSGEITFASASLSSNVNVSASTPTSIETNSITMPSSGCPCRIFIFYSMYITTTTSGQGYSFWVNDGTTNITGVNVGQSNGSSGALTSASYGGFSSTTYANGTAVTLTLMAEGDHTFTVLASPTIGSAQSATLQSAVILPGAGNGTTVTIASGTASLGTSAIPSNTCASAVTVSATGVLATDDIMADFNTDPTGSLGYQPGAMLTIVKYPTSGNVNFKVCNNTVNTITPVAQTLNWRVVR